MAEPGQLCTASQIYKRCNGALVLPDFDADRESASDLLVMLSQHVDLAEPFERIREAIREAHRLGADNQDVHEQAA